MKNEFLLKMILKRVLPSIVGLAILVLAGLWLYGYVGVKAGWIGPTEVHGLNSVSKSGADAAGGTKAAIKQSIGL